MKLLSTVKMAEVDVSAEAANVEDSELTYVFSARIERTGWARVHKTVRTTGVATVVARNAEEARDLIAAGRYDDFESEEEETLDEDWHHHEYTTRCDDILDDPVRED